MDTPQDKGKLRDHLLAAMDHLLSGVVALGGLHQHAPLDALDNALGVDKGYQEAREQLRDSIQALLAQAPSEALRRLVLDVEEAAHHQAAVAVEVGFRVGILASRNGR